MKVDTAHAFPWDPGQACSSCGHDLTHPRGEQPLPLTGHGVIDPLDTSDGNFLSQLQNRLCLGYFKMGWKSISILPPRLNSLQFCGSSFGTVRVNHQAFSAFIGPG